MDLYLVKIGFVSFNFVTVKLDLEIRGTVESNG